MIFGLSWIFCGLSLMDCLWWTAWNGFQLEFDWISAAICVCGQITQVMATREMEELYWLLFFVNTLGFLSGILSAYCNVAKAAIQLLFVAWSVCLVLLLFGRPVLFCVYGGLVSPPLLVLPSLASIQVRTNGA